MARIRAEFSDRDSANLTLLRLRRSGIDFDLLSLSTPKGVAEDVLPGGFAATASITCPQDRSVAEPMTELSLSVKQSQLEKAWDVLRSTGAREIRSRS